MLRDRLRRSLGRVRRAVLIRRRPLAAVLTAVAVGSGVHAATAPPPPTVPVLTAARALPAGTVLTEADLARVAQLPDAAPAGAVSRAVGRTLASPLTAGEPVTGVRLVGRDLAASDPTRTAVPVRLPDAAMAALLAPGDRIDLIATDPQGGGPEVVAADAVVLAVPPSDPAVTGHSGALVLLGTDPGEVTAVSEAGARLFLSFAFSRWRWGAIHP